MKIQTINGEKYISVRELSEQLVSEIDAQKKEVDKYKKLKTNSNGFNDWAAYHSLHLASFAVQVHIEAFLASIVNEKAS